MTGPMIGPQTLAPERVVGEEQRLPERVGHPRCDRAGDEQADDDVADHRRPLHHEDVTDRGEALAAEQPAGEDCLRSGPTCPSRRGPPSSRRAPVGLLTGRVDDRWRTKSRNAMATQTIMIGPPTNSAAVNCQPEQQRQDDAELDDQVRAGDLEGHRGGEVRALAEQRSGQRDRGVRARRRGGPEACRRSPASAADRRRASA